MKQLTLLLLTIWSVTISGQISITGTVTDDQSMNLANANVLLYSMPDSLFITGAITDGSGKYGIDTKENFPVYLEIRSMGYKTSYILIETDRTVYNIRLATSSQELEEVVVVAQKPIFEKLPDRLNVNVASNITSLGGTSLELLEKSPGVRVNRVSHEISLNGKQGVLIMIDNKIRRLPQEALINLLSSIQASELETIELITNPPARYEAGGSGGIIHLITRRKDTDGWSSSLGGFLALYDKPGGGVKGSVTWNRGSFNGFASYSTSIDQRLITWSQDIRQPLSDYNFFSESLIARDDRTWLHNLSLGFNYAFNPQLTWETLVTGFRRNYHQTGNNSGRFSNAPGQEEQFTSHLFEDNIRNMGTIYTGLRYNLHPDHQLSVSAEYIVNNQDQPSSYMNDLEGGEPETLEATKYTPMDIWIGQFDYRWQVNPSLGFAAGTKYSLSLFDNRVDILTRRNGTTIRDDELSLFSELDERIFAAYLSSRWQVTDKWNLQAGLRVENADTELTEDRETLVVDRRKAHLFPNLTSELQLSERCRISISYGRRINRPGFSDLALFVFFPNPVTLVYGNPGLLPGISQNMDFNFSHGEFWVTFGLTLLDDMIAGFQPYFDRDQSLLIYQSENFQKAQIYKLQAGFPIRPAKWLSHNNNITLRTARFGRTDPDDHFNATGLDYQGDLQVRLPWDFTVGINGILSVNSPLGIQVFENFGKLDIGIRKKFGPGGGTLGITATDVLNTFLWNVRLNPNYKSDLYAYLGYTYGMRGVRISYSLSLGNDKIKKKAIDTGSAVEKGRL